MKKIFCGLLLLPAFFFLERMPAEAQNSDGNAVSNTPVRISWMSFEDALLYNAQRAGQGLMPRKVFVDVYTDWCGWCKRLDANTFSHPEIVRYMDSMFIAVKLNAERTDTVSINGQLFVNRNLASGKRGTHDLAITLLQGKMSYPTCTFLDEQGRQITVVPGYMGPDKFEVLLHFIAEDAYKTQSWEQYEQAFRQRAKVKMSGD